MLENLLLNHFMDLQITELGRMQKDANKRDGTTRYKKRAAKTGKPLNTKQNEPNPY